jgi:hypothetical protein
MSTAGFAAFSPGNGQREWRELGKFLQNGSCMHSEEDTMDHDWEFFDMSFPAGSRDLAIITEVYNQGIDAWLEGFTRSRNHWEGSRLHLDIHREEMSILLRRLLELAEEIESGEHATLRYDPEIENNPAESLADDIVYVAYGHETI